MRRRRLVFGIVFLLLGASILIGSSLAYGRRVRSEAQVAQEHPNEWHLSFNEPTDFEESSAWAGLISVTAGICLMATEGIKLGIKLVRSRLPQ